MPMAARWLLNALIGRSDILHFFETLLCLLSRVERDGFVIGRTLAL
jgi:hypothetical protein